MCVFVYVCVGVCVRSEEHTSELQSHLNLVCRLLLEKNTYTAPKPANTTEIRPHTADTEHTPATTRATHHHQHHHTLQSHRPNLSTHSLFFFTDRATPETSPLPPHDPFPI